MEDFFQIGGTLSEDAPSYIERPADQELVAALQKMDLCLVLAPRQSGKSSLMVHAAAELRKENADNRKYRTAIVDLQPFGSHQDQGQWFSDVLCEIEDKLRLDTDAIEWWEQHQRLGPTLRFMNFLKNVVLEEINDNVIIFFDEVDSVLNLPFSDDFFTTLRALFNARAITPELKRLTFVLVGVTTPSDFVKDRTRTPFNIGRSIELTDFNKEVTEFFKKVLGENSESLIDRIFYWTNGQPFFVQTLAAAAYEWQPEKRQGEQIDHVVEESYLQKKIEQDIHLQFMQNYLLDKSTNVSKTLKTYLQVLKGKTIIYEEQSPVQNRLKLAGVVSVRDKTLQARNRIYQHIFNLQWVKAHLPKEIQKWVAYGSSALLVLILLWTLAVQPLFFPTFPDIPAYYRLTEDVLQALSGAGIPETVLLKLQRLKHRDFDTKAELLKDIKEYIGEENVATYQELFIQHAQRRQLVKYSAQPSVEIEVSLANTDVSRAFLNEEELSPLRGGLLRKRLSGLPVGPSTHELKLVAGLFKQSRTIPVEVVYYPNWEIKQFPDKRLQQLNPILEFDEQELRLKNIMNGNVLATYKEYQSELTYAILSPDRKQVLAGYEDGTIKLLDAVEFERRGDGNSQMARELKTFTGHKAAVRSLAFSSDGKLIVSGGDDKTLNVWDLNTGQKKETFTKHEGTVSSVAFSQKGKKVISGSESGTIRLCDRSTEKCQILIEHTEGILDVAFAPDDNTILSGSTDHTLRLWQTESGKLLNILSGHTGPVRSVVFSPDGKRILSGSEDTTMRLWEVATGKTIEIFDKFSDTVETVAFSSPGQLVWGQSEGKNDLGIWDIKVYQELQAFAGHKGGANSVVFSPNGKTVISTGEDKTIKLWDVQTGKVIRTFRGHTAEVFGVAFAPDGRTALSGDDDNVVKWWNVETGDEIRTFLNAGSVVGFSPDGKIIVSAGEFGDLNLRTRFWDVETGSLMQSFPFAAGLVRAFSPDGKTILLSRPDGVMKIFDVRTGQEVLTFSDIGLLLEFSPDGKTAIAGDNEGNEPSKLLDVKTGQKILTFSETEFALSAFSPDNKRIVFGSEKGTPSLWDVSSGQALRTFSNHAGSVFGVTFSPDGKSFISAGEEDGILKLWWAALEPTPQIQPALMEMAKALFLPTFPEMKPIIKHTPDSAVRFELSLSGSNVSRVLLNGKEEYNAGKKAIIQSKTVYPTLEQLPKGQSTHTLEFVGGLFSRKRRIPIEITYYPGWEIRQFPKGNDHLATINDANIRFLALTEDSKRVLSGDANGVLKSWDRETGKLLKEISFLKPKRVNVLAFAPDGSHALAKGESGRLNLWNMETGQIAKTFEGYAGFVQAAVFAPENKIVTFDSFNNILKLWDVSTGQELRAFNVHGGWVSIIALSNNGKTVVSGSHDGTLKLWDVATGNVIRTFSAHTGSIHAVVFSKDDQRVLTGSSGTMKLWDIESGEELQTFSGHDGIVHAAAFAPDGKRVLSGSTDDTMKLWDVATGQELRSFSRHNDAVTNVLFAPDGTLLSGSSDGTVRLWWAGGLEEPKGSSEEEPKTASK